MFFLLAQSDFCVDARKRKLYWMLAKHWARKSNDDEMLVAITESYVHDNEAHDLEDEQRFFEKKSRGAVEVSTMDTKGGHKAIEDGDKLLPTPAAGKVGSLAGFAVKSRGSKEGSSATRGSKEYVGSKDRTSSCSP